MSTRRRTPKNQSPQLGEISFDDWYEVPVFDTEPDERLEQLATSRRRPLRLVANALLRVKPDQAGPSRPPLRERVEQLLDRWADVEVAGEARLESIVMPKRWRAGERHTL